MKIVLKVDREDLQSDKPDTKSMQYKNMETKIAKKQVLLYAT